MLEAAPGNPLAAEDIDYTTTVMPLSDLENWNLGDMIGQEIWSMSGFRQKCLAEKFRVDVSGSLGGQQAMVKPGNEPGSSTNPLSWVPDLVGIDCVNGNAKSVMFIGSAYAPFIKGFTSRGKSLEFDTYKKAEGSAGFLKEFLGAVVHEDPKYYGKIDRLLGGEPSRFKSCIITDWCRASFVKRGAGGVVIRSDKGGDPICEDEGAGVFFHYVAENLDWHQKRMTEFNGKIVLLGLLSRRCMEFACAKWGWKLDYTDVADENAKLRPTTIAGVNGFWTDEDDAYTPAAVGRIDRGGQTPKLLFTVLPHPARSLDTAEWTEPFLNWIEGT